MPEFLTLLAGYYLCNSIATTRLLSVDEAARCARTLEVIKAELVQGEEDPLPSFEARVARNRAAYAAFKGWEEANLETVCALKRQANEAAGLVVVTAAN